MNQELLALHNKVNEVIYNPFVNLKDQIKEIKKVLVDTEKYNSELSKLDMAFGLLDDFEKMPYGNLERIKGFNKTKNNILKVIKELTTTP
jgi:hypothetical protein